jgi:type II secretory pathway pseudopilin PulG
MTGLVLLTLVGLAIAALVVPNLLNGRQRGRQKWTMGGLRTLGPAVESYSIDNNAYSVAASIDELAAFLEPTYIKDLPRRDGWGMPYEYRAWHVGNGVLLPEPPNEYLVRSRCGDRAWATADPSGYIVSAE